MKRILFFVFILFFTTVSNAGVGIWSSATLLKVNGSVQYFNNTAPAGNSFGSSNFQSANLGVFVGNAGQLMIGGGAFKSFNSGGNVCGGTIYYTVYTTGNRPVSPTFSSIGINDFGCNCSGGTFSCTGNSSCSNGDQVWKINSPSYTDITSGLSIGNYTLEVYFSLTGDQAGGACNAGAAFDNNGGNSSNYTATFSISSVLPLQLISFNAKEVNKTVQLSWTVSDNQEAASFSVQRSDDGSSFETIGNINATNAQGNATYTFVDANPKLNVAEQYQLKIIFRNGNEKYSYKRIITIHEQGFSATLKTNPVHDQLNLLIQNDKATSLIISIINDKGQLLHKQQYRVDAGNNNLQLMTGQLPSAVYTLVLNTGSAVKTISFVKN